MYGVCVFECMWINSLNLCVSVSLCCLVDFVYTYLFISHLNVYFNSNIYYWFIDWFRLDLNCFFIVYILNINNYYYFFISSANILIIICVGCFSFPSPYLHYTFSVQFSAIFAMFAYMHYNNSVQINKTNEIKIVNIISLLYLSLSLCFLNITFIY